MNSCCSIIPNNPTTSSFRIPSTAFKFLRTNLSFHHHLHSDASLQNLFSEGRNGFSVNASKKRRKGTVGNLLELKGMDDGGGGEDEEEEEMVLPFEGMKRWLLNKPSGFGEGKEYDTSIEDKLAQEIEQSRVAQAANLNKLKNSNPSSKKEVQKEPEVVPTGIRVRVGNLPKKKNIHRDLQTAFKGFPGITNISPAVSGNKKTREPICKGFAFVYLGSEEAANRFVDTYSKRSITFGKIEKQVTLEIANPRSDSVSEHSLTNNVSTPELILPIVEKHPAEDSDVSLDTWEVTSIDESVGADEESISANLEKIEDDIQHLSILEPNDDENLRPSLEAKTDSLSLKEQRKSRKVENKRTDKLKTDEESTSANLEKSELDIEHLSLSVPKNNENLRPSSEVKTSSMSSEEQQKSQKVQKKRAVKQKTEKISKLIIPGSAKRLKVKDKSLLADVLTRYATPASLASQKDN